MRILDSVKNIMQQSHGGFVLKGSHQMWSVIGMDEALEFYLWSDRGAIGLRVLGCHMKLIRYFQTQTIQK